MKENQSTNCSFSAYSVGELKEIWAYSFDQFFLATNSSTEQPTIFHQITLNTLPENDYELIACLQNCFITHGDANSVPLEIVEFTPSQSLKHCNSLTSLIKNKESIVAITCFQSTETKSLIGTFFCDGERGNFANVSHYYPKSMNILSFLEDFCERYDAVCKSKTNDNQSEEGSEEDNQF